MNDELNEAKDSIIAKFEDLLDSPLIIEIEQHDAEHCTERICESCDFIRDLDAVTDAIERLRHRELVEQTLQAAKAVGGNRR